MPDRAALKDYARELALVEASDWSDAKVNNLLDEATYATASAYDWPFLEADTTITFVNDQEGYNLPSDFDSLIIVLGNGGEDLTETTRRAAQLKYLGGTNGTPQEYYFWKEQLAFAPIPNNSNFPSVIVDYVRTPTLMTNDTDTPEWNANYHYMLADYAAARMWEREEDFERAQYYMDRYFDQIIRMINHYRNRANDDPLIIGKNMKGMLDPQRPFMTWSFNQ